MDKNNEGEVQGFYSYNLGSDGDKSAADKPSIPPPQQPRPAQSGQPPTQPRPQQPRPAQSGQPPAQPRSQQPRPAQSGQPPAGPRTPQPRPQSPERAPRAGEGDFKVNFDFDGEYNDVPEDTPIRVRRERRTGCFGGLLLTIFVICVSLVLASLLWLAATDILGFGADNEVVQVTVPKEFSVESIATLLRENGLIKYEALFKFYSKFSDIEEKIVSGTYMLNRSFDYRALVYGMSAKGSRVTIDVTFPEGFTLKQIFDRLEENGVCEADDMWDAAANAKLDYEFLTDTTEGDRHRLEGFLFPDTYTFYMGDTPSRVLSIMLNNFGKRFIDDYYEKAEQLGYSVREIIIIASMIEREAKTDVDRPLIASVMYNRLSSESYPRLEIDATIRYVIAETGEGFSIDLDSPYNTYVVTGLPPGPISNPGIKSIQAALEPETTGYYFYALAKDGNHKFSVTYEEHKSFVNSDEYGG